MSTAASSRRRRWPLLALLAAFALFGVGMVELFQLRFETGDVYPPYSTLRSDPLGAAAFYEALETQPGLRVERNLRSLTKLGKGPVAILGHKTAVTANADGPPPTCFYLGADPYAWPRAMDKPGTTRLEEILRTGGRVVLTFQPGTIPLTVERPERNREDQTPPVTPAPASPPSPGASPSKKQDKERAERARRMMEELLPPDLITRWGLDFRRLEKKPDAKAAASPSPAKKGGFFSVPTPTPGETPTPSVAIARGAPAVPVPGGALADAGAAAWHTALDFDLDTPAAKAAGWHALYTREGKPVLVARPYGMRGGELVLASDSYFLSNEALRAEPNTGLLAGLVGNGRRIIFDESHHGVQEDPGLMTLARRYGLQGALAAVGLLVGLFIWRNVVSLVPPAPVAVAEEGSSTGETVTGRDSAAGFLNLVRRGVPPRELVGVCLAQWQSGAGGRAPDQAAVGRLRAVVDEEAARPAGQRSPATAYRAMCAAVKGRR